MNNLTIWTKQHRNILQTLQNNGRHITRREHIVGKLEDISRFYLDVYTWYSGRASGIVSKPDDVLYPIWVTLNKESTLDNDSDTVVLELQVDASLVVPVNYDIWGYVVNYLYVPRDEADAEEHKQMLQKYGIDDPQAYMSSFYPAIRQKIIKSWDQMFENLDVSSDPVQVGTIWEIHSEWVKRVIG